MIPTITLEAAQDIKSLFGQMTAQEVQKMLENMLRDNNYASLSIVREKDEGDFTIKLDKEDK